MPSMFTKTKVIKMSANAEIITAVDGTMVLKIMKTTIILTDGAK